MGLFGIRKKVKAARKRGQSLIEASMAIQEGRAEAHPTAIEQGLYGPISLPKSTRQAIGHTFADSLMRTYAARQKGRKKKKPVTAEVDEGLDLIERER